MNAIPPTMEPGASAQLVGDATPASHKWAALADAAEAIARLAGIESAQAAELRNFPTAMGDAPPWRRALAEQWAEDIAAMVEPGLAALLSAEARGGDPRPPARALWRELADARAALQALSPPGAA